MSEFLKFQERIAQEPLVVILGSQGSGTNLLAKFLRKVFDFSVVHDRSLFFNAAVDIHHNPSQRNIDRQLRRMLSSIYPSRVRRLVQMKNYDRLGRRMTGIKDHVADARVNSGESFARFFYDYQAFAQGSLRTAFKSDDIWERIEYLSEIFPNCHYVLLVRDPRDNALSIVNKDFGPREIYSAAKYVKKRIDIYAKEVERFPDRSIVVTYENMLTDPHGFVRRFAKFVDLPLHEDVESRIEQVGVRSTNYNKWKQWAPKDLAAAEAVLADDLLKFGYELGSREQDRAAVTDALGRFARDCIRRVPQKIAAYRKTMG